MGRLGSRWCFAPARSFGKTLARRGRVEAREAAVGTWGSVEAGKRGCLCWRLKMTGAPMQGKNECQRFEKYLSVMYTLPLKMVHAWVCAGDS